MSLWCQYFWVLIAPELWPGYEALVTEMPAIDTRNPRWQLLCGGS